MVVCTYKYIPTEQYFSRYLLLISAESKLIATAIFSQECLPSQFQNDVPGLLLGY